VSTGISLKFLAIIALSDLIALPYDFRVGPSGPLALSSAFGKPAIATYNTLYLSKGEGFISLLHNSSPDEVKEKISDIYRNKKTYEVMSSYAHLYAAKYHFNKISEIYYELFIHVIS
jgi:glycosyltransferase involved in cell wall biosynthesis